MVYLTPHISHTYPAHYTYPTHIDSKRIPPIRIPPARIHAMRIHSKGYNIYPTNHHTYPIYIQHITHIPHISIPNVSIPNVSHQYVSHQYVSVQQHISHQYVSMLYVSIPKWCISRNRKSIPPIRIFNMYPTSTDPLNVYPFKKFASAGMAMSMNIITSLHIISYHCYSAGMAIKIKTLLFLQFLYKIIDWI